jgi:hypothetical protein
MQHEIPLLGPEDDVIARGRRSKEGLVTETPSREVDTIIFKEAAEERFRIHVMS